jgi:hypothetical protein
MQTLVRDGFRSKQWLPALPFAILIDALVIGLLYYWFAVADRYAVFLYNHDMGPNVPDTSPFSPVTSSRYWMSGLVAAAMVMILYLPANWLLARISSRYQAPAWWSVWALAFPLLLVAIPMITMTQNQPVLPWRYAIPVLIAALAALALALSPGRMAAHRPVYLIWLAADAFGLMLILVTLPGLQFLKRWLENDQLAFILLLLFSFAAGLVWLLLMSGLRVWRDHDIPTVQELVVAGFAYAYLLIPLLHHLLFTGEYRYITDSDNFLARNPLLQLFIWIVILVVAITITALRKYLILRRYTRKRRLKNERQGAGD